MLNIHVVIFVYVLLKVQSMNKTGIKLYKFIKGTNEDYNNVYTTTITFFIHNDDDDDDGENNEVFNRHDFIFICCIVLDYLHITYTA